MEDCAPDGGGSRAAQQTTIRPMDTSHVRFSRTARRDSQSEGLLGVSGPNNAWSTRAPCLTRLRAPEDGFKPSARDTVQRAEERTETRVNVDAKSENMDRKRLKYATEPSSERVVSFSRMAGCVAAKNEACTPSSEGGKRPMLTNLVTRCARDWISSKC